MRKMKISNGPDKIKSLLYPDVPNNKGVKMHKNNLLLIKRIDSVNKLNKRKEVENKSIKSKSSSNNNLKISQNSKRPMSRNEFLNNTKSLLNQISNFPKDVFTESTTCFTHKNFGKTPQYVEKFKIEAEEKLQERMRLEEEATYPKGTRLLEEREKISLINDLVQAQNKILNQIEKMPISNRSLTVQKQKIGLEKKLEDLDNDIQYLKRRKVFVLK